MVALGKLSACATAAALAGLRDRLTGRAGAVDEHQEVSKRGATRTIVPWASVRDLAAAWRTLLATAKLRPLLSHAVIVS